MAQKKKDEEVLLVRDEKTGEIGVVAGLSKDGTPKRTPAKAENSQDFLRFDKSGDVLDNFFRNFYRQCKEPKRFGFYRVAVEGMEKVIDVLKEMLKKPEDFKDMLAPHKVDTSAYEQAAQEQAASQEQTGEQTGEAVEEPGQTEGTAEEQVTEGQQPEETQTAAEAETQEQTAAGEGMTESTAETQGQSPVAPVLDENGFNWVELEKTWGISQQDLAASGELKNLNGKGLSDLIWINPEIGGERFEIQARLEVKTLPDGSKGFEPHFIQKEPKLDVEYKGITFSEEDKKKLLESGNLGRVAEVIDKETGEITPSYISIDRKTNEITDIPVSEIGIHSKIGKTEIAQEEQALLAAGLPLRKEIELANGKKFTTTLQVNVEYKGVEFVPRNKNLGQNKSQQQWKKEKQPGEKRTYQADNGNKPKPQVNKPNPTGTMTGSNDKAEQPEKENEQKQSTWLTKDGKIRPITQWKKQAFSDQQKADYVAGRTVVLANSTDKEGNPCTLHITFDWDKQKPVPIPEYPNLSQAKEITPSNESRTQMAVNNEGKTNEATKHTGEPLQQGQVAPANGKQQERQQQGKQQGQQPDAEKPDAPKKSKGMKI
ncbi:DUF4099 domain-containing protein [Bacteroides fragilis]|uniref:DUF4099 domain-containing protein n=1 Tax=Bacteroides fragilis TaxID=817 RepID=UPI0020306E67|nr:DUF4099 domain-containing protein [Bacteroides fragilis]MCM0238763.1 DUF4099 domain-containing protein [Bacteroides fragilis]